jgi:hypothetical protein
MPASSRGFDRLGRLLVLARRSNQGASSARLFVASSPSAAA